MTPSPIPTWTISGIVCDTRELKTAKENKTWAYSVKVIAMGGTFELTTKDQRLFEQFGEGMEVECVGRFEHFNRNLNLIVTAMKDLASSKSPKLAS